MKKINAALAATALTFSSFVGVTTPAAAQTASDLAAMDAICSSAYDAYIAGGGHVPPPQSGFIYRIAYDVTMTSSGGGSVTYSNFSNPHQNGQSVNVHAMATETTSGAGVSYSFKCGLAKDPAGSSRGPGLITPDGHALDGTFTYGGTGTSVRHNVQVVICNSPGKVPGVWRAQNGYDTAGSPFGVCGSQQLLNNLVGGYSTPSASDPDWIF